MKVFQLDKQGRLSKQDQQIILDMLNTGGVIVVPTDTSYGLAARIDKTKALEKLFKLKGRLKEKTSAMVVKSRAQANEYGVISCKPKALWKALLPGPATLVVWSRKEKLPYIRRSDGTVAIRQIPTAIVNTLLKQLPVPLTITSANRSGKEDIYSLSAFLKQHKRGTLPSAFIDAGPLKKRKPSTVISVKKGEPVSILRNGPISEKEVRAAITNA